MKKACHPSVGCDIVLVDAVIGGYHTPACLVALALQIHPPSPEEPPLPEPRLPPLHLWPGQCAELGGGTMRAISYHDMVFSTHPYLRPGQRTELGGGAMRASGYRDVVRDVEELGAVGGEDGVEGTAVM